MLRQGNKYAGVYHVILMNTDNCKLAEISASPKKNENKYTYSLRNQKAGRNFG